MFIKSFSLIQRKVSVLLLLLACPVMRAAVPQWMAGAFEPIDQPWYVVAGMGTSFGQCTFRSITENDAHAGFQCGIAGGYRMNRLISFEAGLQFGGQTETALDCCPYWLSADGERFVSPVIDKKGWYYRDIESSTGWGKLMAQANFEVLSLFMEQDFPWSFSLAPQLSIVTTRSKLITSESHLINNRQWHIGIGGQAIVGYRINDDMDAAIYSGITCLTGKRFDNIPEHEHKSNFIWDAGIRLVYRVDLGSYFSSLLKK